MKFSWTVILHGAELNETDQLPINLRQELLTICCLASLHATTLQVLEKGPVGTGIAI